MTIGFHAQGAAGLALLNSGILHATLGESAGPICPRPSLCSIEGDGTEGGGSDPVPLLAVNRLPLPIRCRDEREQQVAERELRAIDLISTELNTIRDLTSGPLRAAVISGFRGLENERLWLNGKVILDSVNHPCSTREEINALITDIRERKRRPEFQAYMTALDRFHGANSSLHTLRKRFAEMKDPFPPEELRSLLESFWHANEAAYALQKEMNSHREAVITAWLGV